VTYSVQTNQVAKADIYSHRSQLFRMDGHSSAGMAKQEIEVVSKLNLQHMTNPSDLFKLPKNNALPITGCFTCTFKYPQT